MFQRGAHFPSHVSLLPAIAMLAEVRVLLKTSKTTFTMLNTQNCGSSMQNATDTLIPELLKNGEVVLGARVEVAKLFGNMPVRLKQQTMLNVSAEWNSLILRVVSLLLASQARITLTMSERDLKQVLTVDSRSCAKTGKPSFNVDLIFGILSQTRLVSQTSKASFVPLAASNSHLKLKGVISLDPARTKQTQFLSIDMEPVKDLYWSRELLANINRAFENSRFGTLEEQEPDDLEKERRKSDKRFKRDGLTKANMRNDRKGLDRWPVLALSIRFANPAIASRLVYDDGFGEEFRATLAMLSDTVGKAVTEWLQKWKFKPRKWQTADVSFQSRPAVIQSAPDAGSGSLAVDNLKRHTSTPRAGAQLVPNLPGLSMLANARRLFNENPNIRKRKEDASNDRGSDDSQQVPQCLGHHINKSEGSMNGRPSDVPFRSLASTPHSTRERINAPGNGPAREVAARTPAQQGVGLGSHNKALHDQQVLADAIPILLNKVHTKASSKNPSAEMSNGWVTNMVQRWNNPIFAPNEAGITAVTTESDEHSRTFSRGSVINEYSFQRPSSFNTSCLRQARAITQVDGKFILVKCDACCALALVDQHAASERVKVEEMLTELCQTDELTKTSIQCTTPLLVEPQPYFKSERLHSPIDVDVPAREMDNIKSKAACLARWGIICRFPNLTPGENAGAGEEKAEHDTIQVIALPPLIAERFSSSPALLADVIRTAGERPLRNPAHAGRIKWESQHAWLSVIAECPGGIVEALNSRACRSAIMFHDILDYCESSQLIRELQQCAFPQLCAHGRPSVAGLVQWNEQEARGEWEDEKRLERETRMYMREPS
ncbi:MAG: hypothetical protein Q9159_006887 [Coniocarpon cinnabarinum]